MMRPYIYITRDIWYCPSKIVVFGKPYIYITYMEASE